jgi:hypothetical protein
LFEVGQFVDFRSLLWRELDKAGLLIHGRHYEECRREAWTAGAGLCRSLKIEYGANQWTETFEALGSAVEDDHIRVLGIGHALTQFAIAPLGPLPEPTRQAICAAGGLSNFIVALYDQLLDRNGFAPSILPRAGLLQAMNGTVPQDDALRQDGGACPQRLMASLVAIYFGRIRGLSLGSGGEAERLLGRVILAMYDAESDTVERSPLLVCRKSLQRKASLPFVVMGLPAWLVVKRSVRTTVGWHYRWLYRLGTFLGWIDDAVDEHKDRAEGRPNVFANPNGFPESSRTRPALASQIARNGMRIISEWRERSNAASLPFHVPQALALSLVSWFGETVPDP